MKENLISHAIAPEEIKKMIQETKARIIRDSDKEHVSVERQLRLLDELSQFDLGRFLIQHGGLNGYWTHYVLTHPRLGRVTGKNNRGDSLSDLEKAILDGFSFATATQERFNIFLAENQKAVKEGATLACIPCGMMGELFYLNYNDINDIRLIGVDLDQDAMEDSNSLANEKGLLDKIKLIRSDAWKMDLEDEFDLISSNGLNIYEPNDEKIIALYKVFYKSLLPGGKLVTSLLTYPPIYPDKTEWKMQGLNPEMLLLQRIVFSDILNSKFMCFRTSKQTEKMLNSVGFKNIKFIRDKHNIFPTVVAEKS